MNQPILAPSEQNELVFCKVGISHPYHWLLCLIFWQIQENVVWKLFDPDKVNESHFGIKSHYINYTWMHSLSFQVPFDVQKSIWQVVEKCLQGVTKVRNKLPIYNYYQLLLWFIANTYINMVSNGVISYEIQKKIYCSSLCHIFCSSMDPFFSSTWSHSQGLLLDDHIWYVSLINFDYKHYNHKMGKAKTGLYLSIQRFMLNI